MLVRSTLKKISHEMRDSPGQVEISLCQYYLHNYERPDWM